jgi:hypothetical protein
MKLTDANVYLIEHNLIQNLDVFVVGEDRHARDLAMYVAGVNDMAQAVVEALKEVKNG